MNDLNRRIPMPWNQRWEQFRWRVLPALCFVVTIAACGWLWRQQAELMPFAIGEVHGDIVVLRSPGAGELLPMESVGKSEWALYTPIAKGAVAARVQSSDASPLEATAPIDGVVMSVDARPGQHLERGDPILSIAATVPNYIVCHVPERWQQEATTGRRVAFRQRDTSHSWQESKIDAIGAAVEATPLPQLQDVNIPTRGFPVRIALPDKLDLKPGSQVEVRFGPASGG